MIRGMMFAANGEFAFTISTSTADPDIPSLATAAGWNGTSRLLVSITAPYINTLYLRSAWSFPRGIEITISAGTLVGGVRLESSGGGQRGGTAFKTEIPVTVNNLGTIAGAGGSGGSGQWMYVDYKGVADRVYGGGGAAGKGQGFSSSSATSPSAATNGTAGVKVEYQGSLFGGDTRPWAQNGNGGNGAGWGSNGTTGSAGSVGGTYVSGGALETYTAGLAGYSVEGNSNVSWINVGTRQGSVV